MHIAMNHRSRAALDTDTPMLDVVFSARYS